MAARRWRWRREIFIGKPDERIAIDRHHRHQRKDDHRFLIDSVLRAAGKTTALIGTIEYHLGARVLPAVNTTPESLDLYRIFAELEAIGGTHATMEVSSHALALGRVYGIPLSHRGLHEPHAGSSGFPLTRWRSISRPSSLLFAGAGAPPPRLAVLNRDDEYGRQIPVAGGHAGASGTDSEEAPTCGRSDISVDLRWSALRRVACGQTRFPIDVAADGQDQRL